MQILEANEFVLRLSHIYDDNMVLYYYEQYYENIQSVCGRKVVDLSRFTGSKWTIGDWLDGKN